MSRLIVKNLPNKISADKIKELFAQKGEVTDVQLKYTKDGKFRNFGFVGYKTEEQASEAKSYFDESCIKSMKITVEICTNLGDVKKPRAWSRYAPDSIAYKKNNEDTTGKEGSTVVKIKKKKKSKNENITELLKKHKNDPLFAEFIEAHANDKNSWIKETLEKIEHEEEENDSDVDEDKNNTPANEAITEQSENAEKSEKIADKKISDFEYMKSLMKKEGLIEETESKEEQPKKIRNRTLFHVKITGLPYKCKKKDIKEFFRPIVPFSIRLPLGKGKKVAGFCFVGFRTEQELKKALNKDKLFIGNHRVHIQKYEDKSKKEAVEEEQSWRRKNQQKEGNEESIGESGSIFVRNLPYVITEDELTQLFEKYGPLTEVNMPIDKILRQPKGFATVTFMMPEHAVKAYTELDGTVFSGRMLHLLPAKSEKDHDAEDEEGLSFKEKKAKKLKAQAKSSHNWNTLFLGANAVADVVAATYNTTKEHLLMENNKKTSAAVRLALGETQLVAETKTFLENNGVCLNAFNKPPKKRSKTCILVKNLPANTAKEEIKILFEKYGQLANFIMPNHGITALIDFIEPFEAKTAFTKLAYSQFKAAPLYLEWAPENVFVNSAEKTESTNPIEQHVIDNKEEDIPQTVSVESELNNEIAEESSDIEEPETDTTLFVKNLNFITTEDSLRAHFSGCGRIYSASIAKKKDPKNAGQFLSMGYGFVQFYRKTHANEALKMLQYSTLDDKPLELKRSERANTNEVKSTKKSSKTTKQNGTKILVRNVPFQANRNELHEIFRAFGQLRTLRLPKKLTPGTDQHRGFAFVDFYSIADAKSAFDGLCQSTHLYGRRLVLEWADLTDENEDIDALRKRTAQAFHSATPGGKKLKKSIVDTEVFVEGQ